MDLGRLQRLAGLQESSDSLENKMIEMLSQTDSMLQKHGANAGLSESMVYKIHNLLDEAIADIEESLSYGNEQADENSHRPSSLDESRIKDEEYAGFTSAEMNRMMKSLKTNKATLRKRIKSLGLQGMTTAAAVKAIRDEYGT